MHYTKRQELRLYIIPWQTIEKNKEFRIFDVNNSSKVGIDDFIKCLTNHQLNLSVIEIQQLFDQ